MLRWLVGLLFVVAVAAGLAYVVAGRGAPPTITFTKPDRVVGQSGTLDLTVAAPGAKLTALTVTLEQNGKSTPLFALGGVGATNVDANTLRVTRGIGKKDVPELQQGTARVVVSATRPSFLNLRPLSSSASKD